MKDKLLKMLQIKEARKAELLKNADTSEDVKELRSINSELAGLNEEITELRSMIARSAESQIIGAYGVGAMSEERKQLEKKFEQRGADLKAGKAIKVPYEESLEERAVTIGSSNLVVPKKYSNTLNEGFNEVSGLIDNVNSIPLNGGESYTKGFEVSGSEGDYTAEGADYNEGDPVTDYVDINKAKITAYTEITKEAKKLPNIKYQDLVIKNIRKAIRKKVTRQIMVGDGGSNHLTGIFNAPTKVIPTDSDIEVSSIDETTLDEIVFNYGGDEDVEGGAFLILNKKDLAAFSKVRLSNGQRAYNIKLGINGNVGTISSEDSISVPFIINSVCPTLSADSTSVDTYCMAYGKLLTYELPVFSELEVEESRDYKFKSGQIAFRGEVMLGGNVASYKGFARIKKVAQG